MILENNISEGRGPCLVDYVEALFASRDASVKLSEMAVREVASALEAYARLEGAEVIGTDDLAYMASSAVHALGRSDLAIEAVILGTGSVYSQKLESEDGAAVWIINTEKLFPDLSVCTELAFFSVLYHLVGKMVHLWDESAGQGVLGLKRLRAVSRLFAGGKKGDKPSAVWVSKIIRAVGDRLAQCSTGRGWSATPRVLMID